MELISNPLVAEYDVGGLDPSESTQPSRSNVSINTQENMPNDGSVPSEIQGHTVRRSKRGHIPKRHFEVDGEASICIPSEEDELLFLQRSVIFNGQTKVDNCNGRRDELYGQKYCLGVS